MKSRTGMAFARAASVRPMSPERYTVGFRASMGSCGDASGRPTATGKTSKPSREVSLRSR